MEWKLDNTKKITDPYHDWFEIVLENLSSSGCLFDTTKLTRWNNKYLSKLTNEDLYEQAITWAKKYQKKAFLKLLTDDVKLAKKWIAMERHTEQDPKRINTFNDIENQIDFLYDDIWEQKLNNLKTEKNNSVETDISVWQNNSILPECLTEELISRFVDTYEQKLDLSMDKQLWFDQFKEIWSELWFAKNNKEFKSGDFIGKVWDLAMFLRIMLCGSKQTPDLYAVMWVLGKEKVIERLRS